MLCFKSYSVTAACCCVIIAGEPPLDHPKLGPLGGSTTVNTQSKDAFGQPAANLSARRMRDFSFGNRLFKTQWIAAPASVKSLDGLGPLFNRNSCSGCHVRDGRGRPPLPGEDKLLSMLVRISTPGRSNDGSPLPHPIYGDQISDRALPGIKPEAAIEIEYEFIEGRFTDGTPYQLRKPIVTLEAFGYGSPDTSIHKSARVAPALHGLGLLEAVPEAQLLERVDEHDADGDGISGRANFVWDHRTQRQVLGRFGWKANQPNLNQQNAAAFHGDIGITSELFLAENVTEAQRRQLRIRPNSEPELSPKQLAKLTFYTQTIAVPAQRRRETVAVAQGLDLFIDSGCNKCHITSLRTGRDHSVVELHDQTIHPFTDLLLHDMGSGLADGRPDFLANGREWRTAPLWGIGLIETVNGHTFFLHDGRARNLEEAILWHGGEAEQSKEAFRSLPRDQRKLLIQFLESL